MQADTAPSGATTVAPPACDRCGDTAFSVQRGEPCGRNLAGDPLGGPAVADLELDVVDTAAAWVEAIDAFDTYIRTTSPFDDSKPKRDVDHVAVLLARKSRLYRQLLEDLPISPGEEVQDHYDRSKGTPWGPVVRVSAQTVTIANHHAAGAERRVERRHVWRMWSSMEKRAREIVAAGICTGTYR